ncbi:MAG: hypothetical protein LBQ91_01925 [Oscillospiraceae bacterium]|jgi:fluoride ion exporter CrcB/FEX|nr:hypothetical protein [Oscillospiraceae bacterium]
MIIEILTTFRDLLINAIGGCFLLYGIYCICIYRRAEPTQPFLLYGIVSIYVTVSTLLLSIVYLETSFLLAICGVVAGVAVVVAVAAILRRRKKRK